MKTILIILFSANLVLTSQVFSQTFKFLRNGIELQMEGSNKYIVYENDVCEIKVITPDEEINNYRLEVLETQDLKKPVKYGSFDKSTVGIKLYECNFDITGLEPNKLVRYKIKKVITRKEKVEIKNSWINTFTYSFDSLKSEVTKSNSDSVYKSEACFKPTDNDTVTIYRFDIEVHEITHIEAAMGLVYSNLEYNNYELMAIPGDTTGSRIIKNNGTKRGLGFVLGAIIRPWGYDQRGKLWDIRNGYMFFGLGINEDQKIFENIFLGLGYGYRAFNFTIGIHINPVKKLLEGYSENYKYKGGDIVDIDKIQTREIKINFFAGILIDFSIFDKVFSKVF